MFAEAVARSCSAKNVFLKISQNSKKNTCVGILYHKVAGLGPTTLLK